MICNCALAGTKACENCSNNKYKHTAAGKSTITLKCIPKTEACVLCIICERGIPYYGYGRSSMELICEECRSRLKGLLYQEEEE